jgi:hypothetical protein
MVLDANNLQQNKILVFNIYAFTLNKYILNTYSRAFKLCGRLCGTKTSYTHAMLVEMLMTWLMTD